MEVIKTCENVEFDVIYTDGSRYRVREGFLWEVAENGTMAFHCGCNSVSALFTVSEALLEVIDSFGLLGLFEQWVNDGFDEAVAETRLKNEIHAKNKALAEHKAIFRLGQMDMQQAAAHMLEDASKVRQTYQCS